MKMDIWTELRNKAQERRDAVYADPKSTEKDKKLADDVVKFFRNDDFIRNAPKDTLFELFTFQSTSPLHQYPGFFFFSPLPLFTARDTSQQHWV